MKYSSLSGGNRNGGSARWRFKSTPVKVCFFVFSVLFIIYQLINYINITAYLSNESESRKLEKLSNKESGGEVSFGGDKSTQKYYNYNNNFPKGDSQPHHPRNGASERKKGKPLLSTRIVGVRPSDLHLYQDQQSSNRKLFQCFSTHKQITWDKVNDDFCDCPLDGSDEPSTAACMNGKFYCVTRKEGTSGFIPSSRVNDGICDCLDGTDEHDGYTKCKKVSL